MRLPLEGITVVALEQAVDEAALRMNVDPIALRKRWDPDPNRQRLYDWAAGLEVWRNRKSASSQSGRYRRGVSVATGYWLYLWQIGSSVELAIQGGRIEMCTQNAFRYFDRIAYDDAYAGVALSAEEGDRMCRALGDKDILFLRNHGVIVSGPTVAQAYNDLYYLERAAMVQVLAMQTGRPLHNIDAKLAAHTANQIADESQQALLHFESLKRLLDRDEPGWSRLAAA